MLLHHCDKHINDHDVVSQLGLVHCMLTHGMKHLEITKHWIDRSRRQMNSGPAY